MDRNVILACLYFPAKSFRLLITPTPLRISPKSDIGSGIVRRVRLGHDQGGLRWQETAGDEDAINKSDWQAEIMGEF